MFQRKSSKALKPVHEKIFLNASRLVGLLEAVDNAFEIVKLLFTYDEMSVFKRIMHDVCDLYQISEFMGFFQLYFDFVKNPSVKKWMALYDSFIKEGGDAQLNIEDETRGGFKELNEFIRAMKAIDTSWLACLDLSVKKIAKYYYLSISTNSDFMDTLVASVRQYVEKETGKPFELNGVSSVKIGM